LQGFAFLITKDCTKNGEHLKRVFTALLVRPSPPPWTEVYPIVKTASDEL
jgi:hypothetical protein